MRPIDRGIVGLITKLNNAGYKTVASCSGMREDHPRGPRLLEGYISFSKKDLTTEQQEKIKTVAKAVGLRVWESPLGWKEYVGTSYRGKSALAIYIPESESLNASLFWHKFEDALFGGKFVEELKINPDPDKALYFGEKEKLALSTIGGEGAPNPDLRRGRILWTRESTAERIEILKALTLSEPMEYSAYPWDKLPIHYRRAIAAYYEAPWPKGFKEQHAT